MGGVRCILLNSPTLGLKLPSCGVIISGVGNIAINRNLPSTAFGTKDVTRISKCMASTLNMHIGSCSNILSTAICSDRDRVAYLGGSKRSDPPISCAAQSGHLCINQSSMEGNAFDFGFPIPVSVGCSNLSKQILLCTVSGTGHQRTGKCSRRIAINKANNSLDNSRRNPRVAICLGQRSFVPNKAIRSAPCFMTVLRSRDNVGAAGATMKRSLRLSVSKGPTAACVLGSGCRGTLKSCQGNRITFIVPRLSSKGRALAFHT